MAPFLYEIWYNFFTNKQEEIAMARTEINQIGIARTYDANGKLTSTTYPDRTVEEYDSKGRIIYVKHSDGHEVWCEYDDTGNMLHRRESNGYEAWFARSDKGAHWRDTKGNDLWFDRFGIPITKEQFDQLHAA